tara:strand:- start:34340 stop:34552 length:213 start_codon:yes stop_codon:yes gene_type:complete
MQTRFTNLQAAEEYLYDNSYKKTESFLAKNDKAYIYKHRKKKKFIYVSSEMTYLNSDTMDRGVIWTLEAI